MIGMVWESAAGGMAFLGQYSFSFVVMKKMPCYWLMRCEKDECFWTNGGNDWHVTVYFVHIQRSTSMKSTFGNVYSIETPPPY